MSLFLWIAIWLVGATILSTLLSCLPEYISTKRIIDNLFILNDPLCFSMRGIIFTVSSIKKYSDKNLCVTEILINGECVAKTYELIGLWTKKRYVSYYHGRQQKEIIEILKQADKVYWDKFHRKCEADIKNKSYFEKEN